MSLPLYKLKILYINISTRKNNITAGLYQILGNSANQRDKRSHWVRQQPLSLRRYDLKTLGIIPPARRSRRQHLEHLC